MPTPFQIYSWGELRNRVSVPREEQSVFFVRHGESIANRNGRIAGHRNTRLTDHGREQARQVGDKLPTSIAAAYSSDLSRARETAVLALAGRGLPSPLGIDPRIREVAQGELEGKMRRPIPQYAAGDIDYAPRGGESYRTAAQRVASFLIDLCALARHQQFEGPVVVFTHAGVMRVARCLCTAGAHPRQLFEATPGNGDLFAARLSSLSIHEAW
ncbi:MAG: hypothetical protein ABS35_37635 [Kaistia sp. SCN 65-12]|mgnify:CR=1 FL=1|nr:MAG: hypothetical protein ABS35_37635 [Kaistia sp. SCN 65-12]